MTSLGDFLSAHLRDPREIAVWDCCTMPAAWAATCGYADPMDEWRAAYDTESGAEGIVSAAPGKLAALFERGLGSVGIHPREGEPQEGDIGVLKILGQEAGAIFTGKRWAFVAERGLGFASIDPENVSRVWAVPPHG